jgi:predicted AAA+ superfamily ATPase
MTQTPGLANPVFPRYVKSRILEALADTRVVLILGARQVGKTTLARAIALDDHPAEIFSLDNTSTRQSALFDPTGFVAHLTGPALIDEAQRVPDLLLEIKDATDVDPSPGRFLLTGSANVLSSKKVADALTGRIEVIELWPLQQSEIEGSANNFVDALFAGALPMISEAPVGRQAFAGRVAAGSYPEPRLRSGRRRDRWFESYLRTTFDRDLRDISYAYRLEEMPRLLKYLGAQAANAFSSRGVASALELNHSTVKNYTQLLEAVFLIKRISAWRPGIGSRERQQQKLYVVDTGLLAYLLGANEKRIAEDDQVTGKILENFVAMQVLRHLTWAEVDARQYHWRDQRHEVDIVLETRAGEIAAIEVKAAASVSTDDFKSLARLRDARGKCFKAGVVVYAGAKTLPFGDRFWAVPVSGLWV